MEKIGLFFGSSGGNTEDVANQIKELFGEDTLSVHDVLDASAEDVANYNNLILGCSTWGIGDLQDDFEDFMEVLDKVDLSGKTVAIFGLGDADGYPDTFAESAGIIYLKLKEKGCKLIGKTSTDGYDYDESQAEIDGKFVGLIIDEDNQSELTEKRVTDWVEQLKKEFC